ncbi:MAG TPA: hypothetical protein VM580_17775 [Labilithrix sp.]|jgi:hypothetical protein|nr:hypothetical protein [Labilithrix sp.]
MENRILVVSARQLSYGESLRRYGEGETNVDASDLAMRETLDSAGIISSPKVKLPYDATELTKQITEASEASGYLLVGIVSIKAHAIVLYYNKVRKSVTLFDANIGELVVPLFELNRLLFRLLKAYEGESLSIRKCPA